jgi:hypothetical protein
MPARELIAATTRPLLLGILAEGENYGYAIIQRVRELSNGQLEWTEGMLYPVLHRLEREGLITAESANTTASHSPGKRRQPPSARNGSPSTKPSTRCGTPPPPDLSQPQTSTR